MAGILKLKDKITKPLHHAYVIEGNKGVVAEVLEFLKADGLSIRGNPDIFIKEYPDGFGIGDAREIKRMHLSKAITGSRRFFIIWVESITNEAQNALLKVLEEPSGGSHFFIVIPSADKFLSTVLSRVEVVKQSERGAGFSEAAQRFISSKLPERLKIAEKISKAKDASEVTAVFSAAERLVDEKIRKEPGNLEMQKLLQNIVEMEGFVHGRSPSVKMLLEHLAFILPIMK